MGRIDFSKKIKKIVKKRVSYIKYILKKRNALHLSDNTIKDVSDSSSAKIVFENLVFNNIILELLYSLAVLIVCTIPIYIINRFFPVILGKKKKIQ